MNWVDFNGVIFNLDHITHFYVIGTDTYSEIHAFLNIGYRGRWGIGNHQDYIKVANGTRSECETWRNDIIAGKHNLPGNDKHQITEYLKAINESLGKIAELAERGSGKV